MDTLLMRPDVAVAVTGPLAVSSVAARLTIECVDAMVSATAEHRALYTDGSSISLTIVKPNIPPPDDGTRAHLRRINLRPGVSRTSIVVIDAPGFWAATMRGVLAGISLVSPQSPRGAASIEAALSSHRACGGSTSTPSRRRSRRSAPVTSSSAIASPRERVRSSDDDPRRHGPGRRHVRGRASRVLILNEGLTPRAQQGVSRWRTRCGSRWCGARPRWGREAPRSWRAARGSRSRRARGPRR